ncbi:MAG TPA: amidinotransferase [Planctomycetota bacterium]|nr:amidinotransferase [Planctomycetota bacterium]
MPLYSAVDELDFGLADLSAVAAPQRVLLADPEAFDVAYAINAHMRDADGALKQVDRGRAREQWTALRETAEGLGLAVDVVPALAGHPDLVFCANQVLPVPPEATPHGHGALVPSHMASSERAGEVPHVVEFLRARGHRVEPLRTTRERLEGMGDGLWHPGRRLLWAGLGPRSGEAAWREIALRYRLSVVTLELADPDFYHLDTCLALLAEDVCLWYPPAFTRAGQKLIAALFARRVEADEREARELFACNAWCPDGERVVLQRGAEKTRKRLASAGFTPLEVETGEFLKAGGSAYCMKLALWDPQPE